MSTTYRVARRSRPSRCTGSIGPAILEMRFSAWIGVGSAISSESSLVAVAIAGAPCRSSATRKLPPAAAFGESGASVDIAQTTPWSHR